MKTTESQTTPPGGKIAARRAGRLATTPELAHWKSARMFRAEPMLDLARQCPRWERCSVNNCPLDEKYPNRHVDPADKEQKCPMEKGVRIRIAAIKPGKLAMSGQTVREHAATLAFERIPVAARIAMIEKGKASLAALRNDKLVQRRQNG